MKRLILTHRYAHSEQVRILDRFLEIVEKKYPKYPGWFKDYVSIAHMLAESLLKKPQYVPRFKALADGAIGDKSYKLNGWHLLVLGVAKKQHRGGVGSALIKSRIQEVSYAPISSW